MHKLPVFLMKSVLSLAIHIFWLLVFSILQLVWKDRSTASAASSVALDPVAAPEPVVVTEPMVVRESAVAVGSSTVVAHGSASLRPAFAAHS